ncbi:hypothetical protein ABIE28_000041 [Devosia sp. 2618]
MDETTIEKLEESYARVSALRDQLVAALGLPEERAR